MLLPWMWLLDEAWDSPWKEMVSQSFKVCGITNAVDGSEDGAITCFKPGKDCSAGLELLKERVALPPTEQDSGSDSEEEDDSDIVLSTTPPEPCNNDDVVEFSTDANGSEESAD